MSRRSYAARWRMGAGLVLGAILVAFALVAPQMRVHAMGADAAFGGLVLATAAAASTRDLKTILTELKALQEKYVGKEMPAADGEKFKALAEEADVLQKAADRDKLVRDLETKAREIPDPVLPRVNAVEDHDTKGRGEKQGKRVIAGYITPGELFSLSAELEQYQKSGMQPGAISAPVMVGSLFGRKGRESFLVPLTAEQRKFIEARLESKAIATIGAGVIEPDRVGDIVRVTEQDQLLLRDVVNVSRTGSSAVEWVQIDSYTRAATPVAENAAKPEATMAVSDQTTAVRTLAVWMPVTEQQLQDFPQIQNMIDVELRWDLGKLEEEQMIYGDGTGQNLLGVMNTTGVLAGRSSVGDTFIDRIRRAITDVRRARYAPNAVAVDPIDWETIVLSKGTDERYIWTVVTDEDGDRIWGLDVVETVAAEENAGNTTEERNIIVGDWRRGATLWDRMQATVAVGWVNDDFVKNRRTIRAEERVAFAVRRPKAFRYIQTQAAVP